jgi:hypothetical protein
MQTVLTIGGTAYAAVDRPGARIHLDRLRRDIRGGYDELAFSVYGGSPTQIWALGTAVSVTCDFGSGPSVKFSGQITDCSWGTGPFGWVQAYTCQGLKGLADRVAITAPDLTGNYVLNRQPDDPYYASTDTGLTVGQIFTRVLTIVSTAQALNAQGIGNYTGLPSAPVLPAATVADFALLTIVPPQPVQLGGENVLNILEQILSRWMPKYLVELKPDGTIRCKDTTDVTVFVPRTLTLPSTSGLGDHGVQWPRIRSSSARCATRLVLRGGPIAAVALLSTVNGTLEKAWSSTDQSAWTLYDFTQPKDAKDSGNASSVTGNSVTVQSTDATKTWGSNFWPGRQGVIILTNTVANGINVSEHRRITTNTALSGGGTSVISWDSSQPLSGAGYNKYTIVGTAGNRTDVGRLYNVRDPGTGNVGTATYIGAHLVTRSPIPLPWANNSKSVQIYYATALVVGGTVPVETPLGVEALPGTGQFRFVQPVVTPNGQPSKLNTGWPATVADGLPTDVQVLALYSRGANQVVVPPDVGGVPQYQGSAYAAHGVTITHTIDVPAYADQWDATAMTALAQQHLDSLKDTVYEGSGELLAEPTWDVLELNYALNYAIAGTTSPWSAMNAPVRGVTIEWPQGTGSRHRVSFEFSTLRRPFSGDDLYMHPSFTGQSIIGGLQGSIGTEMSIGAGPGSYEMPVGQDQGDFSPGELVREGPIGLPARRAPSRPEDMIEITPETGTERRRREAEQSERQGRPVDRREAEQAQAAREVSETLEAARTPVEAFNRGLRAQEVAQGERIQREAIARQEENRIADQHRQQNEIEAANAARRNDQEEGRS